MEAYNNKVPGIPGIDVPITSACPPYNRMSRDTYTLLKEGWEKEVPSTD